MKDRVFLASLFVDRPDCPGWTRPVVEPGEQPALRLPKARAWYGNAPERLR